MVSAIKTDERSELHKADQKDWDVKWKKQTTPWDKAAPHRALVRTLQEAGEGDIPEIPKGGRALVPGCGRGYDVYLFAQNGLNTLGIDVSETAVEAAKRWLESQTPHADNADVQVADFFNLERPDGGYDVFYDYTFLCALPPILRQDWAAAYTRLSSPSALLITLQFPLDGDRDGGPPYSVSEQLYQELLGDAWERVWGRQVAEDERRQQTGSQEPERIGRERIAIWRRK